MSRQNLPFYSKNCVLEGRWQLAQRGSQPWGGGGLWGEVGTALLGLGAVV